MGFGEGTAEVEPPAVVALAVLAAAAVADPPNPKKPPPPDAVGVEVAGDGADRALGEGPGPGLKVAGAGPEAKGAPRDAPPDGPAIVAGGGIDILVCCFCGTGLLAP